MFVVRPRSRAVSISDLRAICVRELPRYKVPSHIEIVDQLPLTAGLKVDRVALTLRLRTFMKAAA
jgi:acyl-CoA synthetase (AMP-forming)/AMP-acid ligase II